MIRDLLSPDRYQYLSQEDSDLYDRIEIGGLAYGELVRVAMKLIEDKQASCREEHRSSTQ